MSLIYCVECITVEGENNCHIFYLIWKMCLDLVTLTFDL